MSHCLENIAAFKSVCRNTVHHFFIRRGRIFFALLLLLLLNSNVSRAQIVINEIGIGAPSGDAAGGGEFTELFNKSGCAVNIGCYVLAYSGTSVGAAGWSVTIPAGTMLGPGQFYLIGGHGSSLLASSS